MKFGNACGNDGSSHRLAIHPDMWMMRIARTSIEAVVLVAGLLLGGSIGIGTVAFTFGIGPLVQFFLPRLRLRHDVTVLASAH